jgi:hypothetical protein
VTTNAQIQMVYTKKADFAALLTDAAKATA